MDKIFERFYAAADAILTSCVGILTPQMWNLAMIYHN